MLPQTKTEIAKFIVQALVARNVAKYSKEIIVDNTDADPDGIILDVGTGAAGMVVAMKAKPQTDALVDKAINCYQSWKESRNKTPQQ